MRVATALLFAAVCFAAGNLVGAALERNRRKMSTAFERLASIIESLPTVAEGVGATIDSLVSKLRDAAGAPTEAQITQLADELEAAKTQIASAIVRGTAAETVEPPPAGGDTGADTVAGPVDDTVAGGVPDDTLTGATGSETVSAGESGDTVAAGDGADTVDAGGGETPVADDTVQASTGEDTTSG